MQKLPEQFVADVLLRTNIVEVIQEHVKLKRAGTHYKACCPFHDEKTPSFVVNSVKQFYYCFGCSAHGDAIEFLKSYTGLSFVEAVEKLADRLGMEVPKEELSQVEIARQETSKDCYKALEATAQFFEKMLRQHPQAPKVVDYLKQRGLTGHTAKAFRIGFAPNNSNDLMSSLKEQNITQGTMQNAGIILTNARGSIGRFRDRVVFPIRDRRGRVVGFGGRTLKDDANEAKYLNSPESPVFSKKYELYGFYDARNANKNLSTLLVVEGYFDVVALHQAGITNAVATLGTALTMEHIELLHANCDEIIFCFDADKAGLKAAFRALELSLPSLTDRRRIKFLFLPDGHDPDSYVTEFGAEVFTKQMKRSENINDFLFRHLSEDLNFDVVESRLTFIERIKPYLEQLPSDGALKELLYDRLSQMVGVAVDTLRGNTKVTAKSVIKNPQNFQKKIPKLQSPAFKALAILLRHRHLITHLGKLDEYKNLQMAGMELLCEVTNILNENHDLCFSEIKSNLPSHLAGIFIENELKAIVGPLSEEGLKEELLGAVALIKKNAKEQAMERLLKQAESDPLDPTEKSKLIELLSDKT